MGLQQLVVLYRDIIMMVVNLLDEPQGADYLVHADEVFSQQQVR
jgi:hypothetical protein